ncbi:uncharacterized protein LOC126704154 [Quercus robur]|uniref:uncharacterized protein LOC126704154 n=1 Tax=Quercus robur TaxID=38942 RepID=UPI0021634DE5|nr:uncharacterized protein LOC126704154 [Quercus robur]
MSSGWIIVLCRGLKASLAPVLTTLVKSTFHCKVVCQCIQIGRKIRALRLAGDIGLESFILEGDSKITIDALAENIVEHAEFGNLFEEAKWLASQFGDVSFNHVRRQGNSAAHNCARHARHVSEYTVWMEDVPPHLSTVIQAELASFE